MPAIHANQDSSCATDSSPKVSVVIPLYNSKRWIRGALRSVLDQRFRDFEILVIDDGSTDTGPQIAAKYHDHRIRIIVQENRGLAGARNIGIRHARGQFIAFLDADDLWTEDKLEKHVALLESEPEIGFTFSWSEMIDETGNSLGMIQRPQARKITPASVFCRNPIGNGSSAVVRRSVLDTIEFPYPVGNYACWFDETFRQSEDIECWTRIALSVATRFSCINETLTRYRIAASGLSADTDRQLETWELFCDKIKAIDPGFVAKTGPLARAYQLRYLARRSVFAGDGVRGGMLLLRALRSSPRILTEEPLRTLSTIAGTLAAIALPYSALHWLRAAVFGTLLLPSTHLLHRTGHE